MFSGSEKKMSADIVRVEAEIAGRTLSLETGKIAKQADGAVVVRYGESVILASAQSATPRQGIDWFPLFVDYREKFQAAGKIPGGRFRKREGAPTMKEILTMRMIDRPLRPLFPDGYNDEVQIMSMALSADGENDPDMLAMIGAASALCISSIPFEAPIGVARVGLVDGELVANPTSEQLDESDMELIVVVNGDEVVMIEAEASEVSEEQVLAAVSFGKDFAIQVSALVKELAEKAAKTKTAVPVKEGAEELAGFVRSAFASQVEAALENKEKSAREDAIKAVRDAAGEKALEDGKIEDANQIRGPFETVLCELVRARILDGKRSDGRSPTELRPISCEVGVLPRTHGSALFTRGETQVMATVTLGTSMDEEMVESLRDDFTRKFMLHYNFPPFSVGEVKPIRGPSRRDIGHGALAEKALKRIIPDPETFPYTLRIVSDVMESNGSSSMATVCGATLSMMDAGVSIPQPVAGISIGLVKEGDRVVLLTDIQGEEDHYGDMDFKVAGTQNGISAIQLDIKIGGLTDEIVAGALEQAKAARIEILREMLSVIDRPREKLSVYAPKLVRVVINPDKIGMVIGSGGKVIRKMQEDYGVKIDIDDDGTITIFSTTSEAIDAAKRRIEEITVEPEVGKIYTGTVRGIKDFGAFVEILPGTEGLLHVSELSDEYVSKVTDFVKMGDEVTVKCIGVDDRGKIRLSRKAALKDLAEAEKASDAE